MAQPSPTPLISRSVATGGAGFVRLFSLPLFCVGLWMLASAFLAAAQGGGEAEALLAEAAFGLVFGGAGLGLLLFSRHLRDRAAEEHALRLRHPLEPWRWRPEWATGRVLAHESQSAVAISVFAVLWNLMMVPFVLGYPDLEGGAFFVVPFALIGIGFAAWAVRTTLRRRKFAGTFFELETLPGVLGGPVRGSVHVPRMHRGAGDFTLTLTCLNVVTTGSGDSSSTHEHERWRQELRLPHTAARVAPRGVALPVAFEIPHDLPASSTPGASSGEGFDDQVIWRLEANADTPGIDFEAAFVIPVFHTADSRSDRDAPRAVEAAVRLGPNPIPIAEGARITAARLPDGGVAVDFPMARSRGAAVGITFFAILWNGALVLFGSQAPAPIQLFLVVFLLFGVCIALGAVDAWFGTIRIRAHRGRLETTRKCLGIGRTRDYAADEIGDFRVEATGVIGKTVLYALKAKRVDRRWRSVLADGMDDRHQAERVLALVATAFEVADGQEKERKFGS